MYAIIILCTFIFNFILFMFSIWKDR